MLNASLRIHAGLYVGDNMERKWGVTDVGIEYIRSKLTKLVVKTSGNDTDPDAAMLDEICNMALSVAPKTKKG